MVHMVVYIKTNLDVVLNDNVYIQYECSDTECSVLLCLGWKTLYMLDNQLVASDEALWLPYWEDIYGILSLGDNW